MRDAQKLIFVWELLAQSLLKVRKISGHQRAEIWQRTARVDERQHHHLAAKIAQSDWPAVLIDQTEVGNNLACPDSLGIGILR